MHLNELKALHVSEVLKQAEELEIENTGRMRKQELMFAIIKKRAKAGEQVFADGVLDVAPGSAPAAQVPRAQAKPRAAPAPPSRSLLSSSSCRPTDR